MKKPCYSKVTLGYPESLLSTLNDNTYRKFWALCGEHGNLGDIPMYTMPSGLYTPWKPFQLSIYSDLLFPDEGL